MASVRVALIIGLVLLTAYLYRLNDSLSSAVTSLSISSSSNKVKLLETIPAHLLPTRENHRRLIVVGDIHGMASSLDELLEEVNFDPVKDHLVTTGDMISKGPESGAVVDRLIGLNASAVRGNHEDHILKARAKMDRRRNKKKNKKHNNSLLSSLFDSEDDVSEPEWNEGEDDDDETDSDSDGEMHDQRAKARDRATARKLKKHHIKWLRSLPVILSAEPVLPIYIVHAGLVPGLQVRKQDPWAVMNMRTLRYPKHRRSLSSGTETAQHPLIPSEDPLSDSEIDQDLDLEVDDSQEEEAHATSRKTPIPTDGRSGQRWADAWNKYQRHLPSKKRKAVVYGHDAKRGHRVGEYTFGLDSGCVAGGKLTAVVIEAAEEGDKKRHFTHRAVQIPC
ncbi:calcineurin-like phosphoesterase domain-containing protein [Sarocladium implicatum]|nr:calcineurin-like phosphoesterase domain-containing protein [Sarocladium implicatum]